MGGRFGPVTLSCAARWTGSRRPRAVVSRTGWTSASTRVPLDNAAVEDNVTEQPESGPIELVLPADTKLVRVARLVASGVATAAGFDVDELEDLRIAVDELCAALIEGGESAPLALTFELRGGGVSVLGRTAVGGAVELEPERLSLSRQILGVVVDAYDIGHGDGELRVKLDKRRLDG